MQSSTFRSVLFATAGSACLIATQIAMAQAATSATATGGTALQEVVVTATKRSENLQNVPLSVSVVSQDTLQSQNLADTSDLQRLVPGLQFLPSNTPANNAFGVRGITTLAISTGLEASAGVAFDGVPLGRTLGAIADLVDIQQVEVLKGPQGMLFGKNASAGLINIRSHSPELGKNEVLARASYGSLNLQQYTGTANLIVTDDSAIRLTAWKFQHDGTIHEVNTGQNMNDKNSEGARLKYRWKPMDNLDLNLTGEWTNHNQNGAGYSIRSYDPGRFSAFNGGALIQAWDLAHGTMPSESNLTARDAAHAYYDKGHTGASTIQGDYSLGEGTLTGIVSYRKIFNDNQFAAYPSDNPYVLLYPNQDTVNYDQWSEEIRYASPEAARLRYVVGLFNFRMKLREQSHLGFELGVNAPFFVNNILDTNLVNTNYAGFGEATFDITSQLHFIAGIRRSTDKVNESMNRSVLSAQPLASAPGQQFGPLAAFASTSYNDTSWRTGLQYQVTPDAMLYATVSRGYKGPGVSYNFTTTANEIATNNNDVIKPEIAHAYEVGLKTQWFDRRVTLNMALYNEIFDNFQTTVRVPVPGQSVTIVAIQNASQAKTTGVDLDGSWLVTPEFSLMGSATYDNARYTDFKNASCYTSQTAAQGCVNSQQILDGKRLASTPTTTTNLTARYESPINATLRGYLQANDSYRSAVIFDSTNDPETVQGGYNLVNLSAGINTADGGWGISVYGNNVFNRHYVDRFGAAPVAGAFMMIQYIGYEDLRTFGVAVNARF